MLITPSLPVLITRSPQPTPKPGLLPTSNAVASIHKTPGGQIVQLNGQELQTVTVPVFTLTGQAPPETVVSVNDDFVVVDNNGTFSFELVLQAGPNLVEIVASNPQGQQVSFEWVVIYEPGS